MATKKVEGSFAKRLEAHGAKRVLIDMAENGQILKLRCEMLTCYCPDGRQRFDDWPRFARGARTRLVPQPRPLPDLEDGPRTLEAVERSASARLLQQHGLRLALTHPLDAREGAHPLLRQDRGGFEQKEERARAPAKSWTARLVRKAYVS